MLLANGLGLRIFLQEAYATENASLFRSYFVAKFRECRVLSSIIGEQQSSVTEIRKDGPIFPQHVIVGMQAIANKDMNRAQLC